MSTRTVNSIEIYRIKTTNSAYEITVSNVDGEQVVICVKAPSGKGHRVKVDDLSFLDKLTIGASFDVPGVVLTSIVQDYVHFVPSTEPKRNVKNMGTIGDFFDAVADHAIRQVKGHAVVGPGQNDEDCYS